MSETLKNIKQSIHDFQAEFLRDGQINVTPSKSGEKKWVIKM